MSLEQISNASVKERGVEQKKEVTVMDELRKAEASGDPQRVHLAMLAADEKYRVRSRVTNITDFIPVVGSAKMIHEAVTGRQLGTGKKIEGWQRALHGVTGTAFLAADVTGVGAVGSVIGKVLVRGAVKAGEKMTLRAVEMKALKQEGGRLVTNGDERIERAKKVEANSEEVVPA